MGGFYSKPTAVLSLFNSIFVFQIQLEMTKIWAVEWRRKAWAHDGEARKRRSCRAPFRQVTARGVSTELLCVTRLRLNFFFFFRLGTSQVEKSCSDKSWCTAHNVPHTLAISVMLHVLLCLCIMTSQPCAEQPALFRQQPYLTWLAAAPSGCSVKLIRSGPNISFFPPARNAALWSFCPQNKSVSICLLGTKTTHRLCWFISQTLRAHTEFLFSCQYRFTNTNFLVGHPRSIPNLHIHHIPDFPHCPVPNASVSKMLSYTTIFC